MGYIMSSMQAVQPYETFFSVHIFMIYCWPAICEKLIMDMEQDNKELERGNVQDLI